MAKIIITGIIFIGIPIFFFAFVPNQFWKLRLSLLWWVLLVLFSALVCILFPKIYPINSTITLRKAIFSIPTGFLLLCLVWSLNSFEQTKIAIILLSMMFKAFSGLIIGYGIFSFINILF